MDFLLPKDEKGNVLKRKLNRQERRFVSRVDFKNPKECRRLLRDIVFNGEKIKLLKTKEGKTIPLDRANDEQVLYSTRLIFGRSKEIEKMKNKQVRNENLQGALVAVRAMSKAFLSTVLMPLWAPVFVFLYCFKNNKWGWQ